MKRDFQENDPRTTTQRRADAHTNICAARSTTVSSANATACGPTSSAVLNLGDKPDLAGNSSAWTANTTGSCPTRRSS